MSYRKLCNSCSPITNALTSNEKYILPYDTNIYCNLCTKMIKYPGSDTKCGCKENNKFIVDVVKPPSPRVHNKYKCCSSCRPGTLYHNYASKN